MTSISSLRYLNSIVKTEDSRLTNNTPSKSSERYQVFETTTETGVLRVFRGKIRNSTKRSN